jgi:anti-sigma factor RsiW
MSDFDLKAYMFGELTAEERRQVTAHLEKDPAARAELARLEATQAMLGFMQPEELPRRIAFVSDKVFEPTWWQRFFASGAQLGFASAALLAVAIVSHGWMSRPVVAAPAVDVAAVRQAVAAEMARQVSAPGASDERVSKMIAVAVKEAEQKAERERAADRQAIGENFDLLRRMLSREQVASYQPVRN